MRNNVLGIFVVAAVGPSAHTAHAEKIILHGTYSSATVAKDAQLLMAHSVPLQGAATIASTKTTAIQCHAIAKVNALVRSLEVSGLHAQRLAVC